MEQKLRILLTVSSVLACGAVLFEGTTLAQEWALPSKYPECSPAEPDAVQINWTMPCDAGTWLLDTETSCCMWDWHPDPHDTAIWTGAYPGGLKDGPGIVQWFEHQKAIDRFEGTFRNGKREGHGHYMWNDVDFYDGPYEQDHPNGWGIADIAGEKLVGRWKNGCLNSGGKTVAITVPRFSCAGLDEQVATKLQEELPLERFSTAAVATTR